MNSLFSNVSPVHIQQVEPKNFMRTDTSIDNKINFADKLKGAIENLNEIQKESDSKTEALAAGSIDDLHDVMITAQKSSIALETTVQIQKKVIDAYNEIMRMQV